MLRVHAAPGDLDPSLGGTGEVVTGIGYEGGAQALVLQPDGKIVAVGYTRPDIFSINWVVTVVRYLADGSLDRTFDGDGIVTTTLAEPCFGLAAALQTDGKIVVAGHIQGSTPVRTLVLRYLPDGRLDTGFHGTGFLEATPGEWSTVGGVAVQSDGRIVVAGGSGSDLYRLHFTIVRFLPDGTPDPSFNGTGKVVTAMATINDYINSVALQSDGKIVVAGTAESTAPPGSPGTQTEQFAAARYLPNGTLDRDFNDTGKFLSRGNLEFNSKGQCVAVQRDGKIVLGGHSWPNAAMVRLDARGRLDPSFNETGQTVFPLGGQQPVIYSLSEDGDGSILAAGGSRPEVSDVSAFVMQVRPDGRLDPYFNGTGFVTTTFGDRSAGFVGVRLEKGGSLVAAGAAPVNRSKFALARYQLGRRLVVEYPADTRLVENSGVPVDFGIVSAGTALREFTIRNLYDVPFTGLTVTVSGQTHAGTFVAAAPAVTVLPTGGSTTFIVAFTPSAAPGPHTAVLNVRGNSGEDQTFTVGLTGRRATASEVWRYTWFASYADSGDAADFNDFDHDGLVNLMEFALGTHPHQPKAPPVALVRNGNELEYTYSRPAASLTELVHQPEFASTPAGPWSAQGISSTVVSDDGLVQSVRATVPLPAGSTTGFVRLKVTRR